MAEWKNTRVLQLSDAGAPEDHKYKYNVILPDFLADWDVYAVWEKERFLSMEKHLKKGDVLFDIGAEKGWQSAIYAQWVGGENMVLIEPTKEYWPNLKQIWEHNNLKTPAACWIGLVGDLNLVLKDELTKDEWPNAADGELFDGLKYEYIHDHGTVTSQITIDKLVQRTGVVPDALTMDCEGCEILILEGAVETMKKHKPKVWASLHPDLQEKNYGRPISEVFKLMESLGYKAEFLGKDHEEHWLFL